MVIIKQFKYKVIALMYKSYKYNSIKADILIMQ